MSFEGYERFLCENGHLHSFDVYNPNLPNENWKCPICKKPIAWYEIVDMTNGIENGVEYETWLIEKTPKKYKICPTCNQKELIEEATYKIPKGKKKWRSKPSK